jgi:hypothetical protein
VRRAAEWLQDKLRRPLGRDAAPEPF